MSILLTITVLGSLVVTSYRSVPSQTDDSPFITANGERVCRDGVAVSQDLLKSKKVKYGDWIYIEKIGLKRINDTMHSRHTNHIDVWVDSLEAEKKFHATFKGKKLRVYIINFIEEKQNDRTK